MPFFRTVLGDRPIEDMGWCYAHEHLLIDNAFLREAFPGFILDSVENSVVELTMLRKLGLSTMVDSMPTDAGRQSEGLGELSRRTGMHIVMPTGLHLAQYYPSGHWSETISEDSLVSLMVSEIDPQQEHPCGVIKVAGSRDHLTEAERRNFRAAGRAQALTGCPVLTHTEEGTAAFEQIDLLATAGADLRHVVLSHLDRKPDLGYHREVLSTGVKLEYDSAFRWKTEANPTLDLMATLCHEFPGQIMLGMDAARPSYWRSYGGGPGLDFLITQFVPRLQERGLSPSQIEAIFVANPAQTYAFREKLEQP